LNVITGNLRRSIFSETIETAHAVTGRAASSGDVKYAAIQEYGGKTAAHDIVPTKAEALAFVMGGKPVFAKIVHHPGSNIPAHGFMRRSLEELTPDILDGYREAARTAVAKR
jgi:phage gpG-like protein